MLPHREAVPATHAEELSAQPAQVAVVDGGTLRLDDRVVRLLRRRAAAARHCLRAMRRGLRRSRDQRAGGDGARGSVVCRVTGMDGLGRPFAICQVDGTELNRAVIAAGWARADTAEPELQHAEQAARAEHRGVWASDRE